MEFLATTDKVSVSGRTVFRDGVRFLGYSTSSVSFAFRGRQASVQFISDPEAFLPEWKAWVAVYINEEKEPSMRFSLSEKEQKITVYSSDTESEVKIKVMKYSEPEYAVCGIRGIEIDGELLAPPAKKSRRIQVIGDSITCGYGIEGSVTDEIHDTATENPTKAYAYRTAEALDAELEIVAWNGKGVITSYIGDEDVPKEESWLVPMLYEYTDAGLEKQYFHLPKEQWEKWNPEDFVPELVIVHLGTNDASYTREIAERNRDFSDGYLAFLETIHKKNPSAKLLTMLGIMDRRLCETVKQATAFFQEKHPELTAEYIELPEQREEDGLGTFWHPTSAANLRAVECIVPKVKDMMGW